MADKTVRCEECGLETKIDVRLNNLESFAFPEAELKQKCKFAKKPGICPHLSNAITAAMQSRQA